MNSLSQLETSTPLSAMDSFRKESIGKDIVEFNNTIYQVAIIDIYRLFHSNNIRTHIFLKPAWDIHQDRSHAGT